MKCCCDSDGFQAAFYEECEVLNYDDLRSLIITMLKPRSCRLPMSEVGLYKQTYFDQCILWHTLLPQVEAQLKTLYQAMLTV